MVDSIPTLLSFSSSLDTVVPLKQLTDPSKDLESSIRSLNSVRALYFHIICLPAHFLNSLTVVCCCGAILSSESLSLTLFTRLI